MGKGNNRAKDSARATFRKGGNIDIKFFHPYLLGQIKGNSLQNWVDVSPSIGFEGEYLNATPVMEASNMKIMQDGSVIYTTNDILAGSINLPNVNLTTGDVAKGDFLKALLLIRTMGDTVGGTITVRDFVNGRAHLTQYLGVTIRQCPLQIIEGNAVATYPVELYFADIVEANGDEAENIIRSWAVGSQQGLEAIYTPYKSTTEGIKGEDLANSGINGVFVNDNTTTDEDLSKVISQIGENPNIKVENIIGT